MDAEARKQQLTLESIKRLAFTLQNKTTTTVELLQLPNIAIATPGVEYSFFFPFDFHKVIISCREGEDLFYSFIPGDSLTIQRKTIPGIATKEFGRDNGYLSVSSIYFSANNPCNVEMYGYKY